MIRSGVIGTQWVQQRAEKMLGMLSLAITNVSYVPKSEIVFVIKRCNSRYKGEGRRGGLGERTEQRVRFFVECERISPDECLCVLCGFSKI